MTASYGGVAATGSSVGDGVDVIDVGEFGVCMIEWRGTECQVEIRHRL